MTPLTKSVLAFGWTAAAWEADEVAEAMPAAPIALSATSTLTETLFLEVEKRMIFRPLVCFKFASSLFRVCCLDRMCSMLSHMPQI
jgi:hypothetical protein